MTNRSCGCFRSVKPSVLDEGNVGGVATFGTIRCLEHFEAHRNIAAPYRTQQYEIHYEQDVGQGAARLCRVRDPQERNRCFNNICLCSVEPTRRFPYNNISY